MSALRELLAARRRMRRRPRRCARSPPIVRRSQLAPALRRGALQHRGAARCAGRFRRAPCELRRPQRAPSPEWVAPPLALGHLHVPGSALCRGRGAFERALALDPDSVEALGNLGPALQRAAAPDLAHAAPRARARARAGRRDGLVRAARQWLLGRLTRRRSRISCASSAAPAVGGTGRDRVHVLAHARGDRATRRNTCRWRSTGRTRPTGATWPR